MIAAVDSLAGEKADRRLLCHWTCQVSVCNLHWNQCNITFTEFCDQGVVASASLVSTFASRNRYVESKDTVLETSLRDLLYSTSGSRFQYWVYICSTFFGFPDNFWGGSHYFFVPVLLSIIILENTVTTRHTAASHWCQKASAR